MPTEAVAGANIGVTAEGPDALQHVVDTDEYEVKEDTGTTLGPVSGVLSVSAKTSAKILDKKCGTPGWIWSPALIYYLVF